MSFGLYVKEQKDPTNACSGFEADIIPAAMLAQRVVGIMAHWREYMRK